MAFQFFEAATASPSGCSAGVFIPRADLPGVAAGEFANAQSTASKQSKAVFALLNQMYAVVSPTNFSKLGIAVTKGQPAGAGEDILNIAYTATIQWMANSESKAISMLPVPTTGTESGKGDFALTDIFANAVKVAADDAITGEGLVIPTADLVPYGSASHGSLNIATGQDNRDWVAGLYGYISQLGIRTALSASAITAASRGTTTGVTLPAAATDTTNPTTGILAADLAKRSVFSHQYSITVQLLLNQVTQQFDVNVVTA